MNPETISLTDGRKQRLEALLELHFQKDLHLWERFCSRVKASPFLMGGGARKWHVTLDWILAKGNLSRVLEGNFESSEQLEAQRNEALQHHQDRETREILASIIDPTWKNWCSQLLGIHPLTGGPLVVEGAPIKAALSLFEVKQMTNARFLEFDGRIVWIEGFDQKTVNKIEDRRFEISPVVRPTYPEARCVRAQLSPYAQTQGGVSYAQ